MRFSQPLLSHPLSAAVALVVLSLPVALAASAAPTQEGAAKAGGVQLAIQSAFDDQDAALAAHDINAAMAPYAPDALFLNDLKGTQDQGLAPVRQGWLTLFNIRTQKLTGASHKINEITVSKANTGATVLALHHLDLAGRTRTGKPFKTGIEETIRYFWAKTPDGWRIKQERILSVDSFVNGKLIRHEQKPTSA